MLTVVFCLLFSVDAVSVGKAPRWSVGLVKGVAWTVGNSTIDAQKKETKGRGQIFSKVVSSSKLMGGRQNAVTDPIGAIDLVTPSGAKSGWADEVINPDMNSLQQFEFKATKKSGELNTTRISKANSVSAKRWAFKNGTASNLGRLQGSKSFAGLEDKMVYNNVTVRKRGRDVFLDSHTVDANHAWTQGHSEREAMYNALDGTGRLFATPVQTATISANNLGFAGNYSRVNAYNGGAATPITRGSANFPSYQSLDQWTSNVAKGSTEDYGAAPNWKSAVATR